jgi:hypothetical protein
VGRKWQEAILNQFAVSNGAFKRTGEGRFAEFDEITLQILCGIPALRQDCIVHDMAVSDGRTACDFFARLSEEFPQTLDFYATDFCLKVVVLRRRGWRTRVVVDERGVVLQLMFAPFVLSLPKQESWLYPVNKMLRKILMHTSMKRTLKAWKDESATLERREILLVCSAAREHLARSPSFHLETYNIFDAAPRAYSVVRAMNVFNRSYFSESAMATAASNVFASLKEGGVFITGSNEEVGSSVNGTVYRKQNGKFVALYESGDGSPIDPIIRNGGVCQRSRIEPISSFA